MAKNLNSWLSHIAKKYTYGIDLGLDRIKKIAVKLKLLKFTCPVVTVAGTNGKGSCIACIEAIALSANLRVGAYTSPHLIRFNERIRIDGKEIEDKDLCDAFAVIDDNVETPRASLTYFEFTTLAALYIFQNTKLDLLLLEVGIGGRLDAVNIIDPDIAVITSISIDHTDYLGDDREAIGYEKAGIMRENVPIVCSDPNPPDSIIKRAKELNAPYYGLNQEFSYVITNNTWQWQTNKLHLGDLPIPSLPLPSAAAALMVIYINKPLNDASALGRGLGRVKLPGRFQQFSKPRHIILDVAHNLESVQLLAQNLEHEPVLGNTLAVVGMLADKDIHGAFESMLPQVDTWYVGGLDCARGAKAQYLAKVLQQFNKPCYTHETVTAAYKHALKNCSKRDRIIVFGSFYTVGEILEQIEDGNET